VTPSSLPKPSRIFSRSDRVILLTTPTGLPGLLGAWPFKNRPSGPLSPMALVHLVHLFDWLEPTPIPANRAVQSEPRPESIKTRRSIDLTNPPPKARPNRILVLTIIATSIHSSSTHPMIDSPYI
jgi:hypothetical protein